VLWRDTSDNFVLIFEVTVDLDGVLVTTTVGIDVVVTTLQVRVEGFQVETCSCVGLLASSVFGLLVEFLDLFRDDVELLLEFQLSVGQFLQNDLLVGDLF